LHATVKRQLEMASQALAVLGMDDKQIEEEIKRLEQIMARMNAIINRDIKPKFDDFQKETLRLRDEVFTKTKNGLPAKTAASSKDTLDFKEQSEAQTFVREMATSVAANGKMWIDNNQLELLQTIRHNARKLLDSLRAVFWKQLKPLITEIRVHAKAVDEEPGDVEFSEALVDDLVRAVAVIGDFDESWSDVMATVLEATREREYQEEYERLEEVPVTIAKPVRTIGVGPFSFSWGGGQEVTKVEQMVKAVRTAVKKEQVFNVDPIKVAQFVRAMVQTELKNCSEQSSQRLPEALTMLTEEWQSSLIAPVTDAVGVAKQAMKNRLSKQSDTAVSKAALVKYIEFLNQHRKFVQTNERTNDLK